MKRTPHAYYLDIEELEILEEALSEFIVRNSHFLGDKLGYYEELLGDLQLMSKGKL